MLLFENCFVCFSLLFSVSLLLPWPFSNILVYWPKEHVNLVYVERGASNLSTTTMLRLPKRIVKAATLAAAVFVFFLLGALFAHKTGHVDIPTRFQSVIPVYFHQVENTYVTDLDFLSSPKLGPLTVARPNAYSQLLNKDLLLGTSWTHRISLWMYLESRNEVKKSNDLVLVDIAVGNPAEDKKIKGNEKKLIPIRVLKDLHKTRVFDAEAYEQMNTQNKGLKLDGKVNPDEIQRLKTDQESKAEDLRVDLENEKSGKQKRKQEKSRHDLEGYYLVPNEKQLELARWKKSSYGVWLKYGHHGPNGIKDVEFLFGSDAKEPRPEFTLLENPLNVGLASSMAPRITFSRSDAEERKKPQLQMSRDNKFKILQAADFHFSTGPGACRDPVPDESKNGCEADPRTTAFFEKVLDLEQPDLVVFTGDQVFGQEAPDAYLALYKVVDPVIKRKIPFAAVFGNHDAEGSASREALMAKMMRLPYFIGQSGPIEVAGEGNYIEKVYKKNSDKPELALFFLDSHANSPNPKSNPGYDWFKDSQLLWVLNKAREVGDHDHINMAFFHIPLPEFKNLDNQLSVGQRREGVGASRYNSGMRETFANFRFHVAAVGHDHANDYCLFDKSHTRQGGFEQMWLCYGGGAGEGGYGGYGGYIRRMRVFEAEGGDVRTWKRAENNPDEVFDVQTLVKDYQPISGQ